MTTKHNHTKLGRMGLWDVYVSPETNHGYMEHDIHGDGGELIFNGKVLEDFDGQYCLPKAVAKVLREHGYTVGTEFDW